MLPGLVNRKCFFASVTPLDCLLKGPLALRLTYEETPLINGKQ